MATAATLDEAAKQAWANLEPFAVAGTLRTRLIAFGAIVRPLFPETLAAGHPVANWNAVLEGFALTMAATANQYPLLRIAADYLYRLCLMGQTLVPVLATQTTALLAAYNATF
jgi:hypothetical protein